MKRALAGSAVLALFLTTNVSAGPGCESPQGEAALRTAALQQYLMVAALTCQRVPAYNGFVVSHQRELQESDRALLQLFMRRDSQRGDADYNAYKTWLANAASMRSLHDPRFCEIADSAFGAAVGRPLVDVVQERPVPLDISEVECAANSPMQHHAALESR